MRLIRFPEASNWFLGMPEIFNGGVYGVIRRAIIISNGCAGAENQSIGLVRALGLSNCHSLYLVTRPIGGINRWLNWLPVSIHKKLDFFMRLLYGNSQYQISDKPSFFPAKEIGLSNILEADAPQIARMARETFLKDGPLLVVASGRDTISVASSIKRLASENVFVVQIQHPRCDLNRFDLVVTPHHDYYPLTPHAQRQIPLFLRRWISPGEPPGRNVILTVGALHQADSTALRNAASVWHKELATLPKPLLVVNVGGPTRNCPYDEVLAKHLTTMLQNVLWSCGTIRISFSRRTPEKISKFLIREFSTNPKVTIWNGEGPNPHIGHLALADAFVITADSVSMLSEACSTGKPVYVIGAELCTWKFADFQKRLLDQGVARPFTGKENIADSWSYTPLDDTANAASHVVSALARRGWIIRP